MLNNGRAKIISKINGLEIVIPSKKNWFSNIFMIFWLCGWIMGEGFALNEVIFNFNGFSKDYFVLFWLCGWTAAGIFAIRQLIWGIFGEEILTFEIGKLTIDRYCLLFSKCKTFDLKEVKNLRLHQNDYDISDDSFKFSRFQNEGSRIKFDYGMETIKLASGIDEAEARYILNKINESGLLRY